MSAQRVETVVTYLSAKAPARPPPPMPGGVRLALMKAQDIPLAYYRYLYSAVGGNWLWFERLLLDDEALGRKVRRPSVEIYVLHANGCPAGYYELDFSKADSTNLVYFGLTPEWTGRRIGPWLLGSALTEAFSRGARQVTVNTCTLDHPAALPLYQRLGFEPIRRETRTLTLPPNVALPGHIAAGIRP